MITIRELADGEDGSIYPIPAQQPGDWLIEREPLDGDQPVLLPVTAVHLEEFVSGGKFKMLIQAEQIKGVLYLTGSRAAFACENYDKGSTWISLGVAAPVALAATGISKALAARRRKGKLLCGQLRWPWMAVVYGRTAVGFGNVNQIAFLYQIKNDDAIRTYKLSFSFKRGSMDTLAVAKDIVRRAANYRLANDPNLSEDVRVSLQAQAETPLPAEPSPKPERYQRYQMPIYSYVSQDNTYPPAAQ